MIQPQNSAGMQRTLKIVRNKHKELLLQMKRPEDADVDQVRAFLKTLAQAGTTIEDVENRSLLLELIRYWSSFINDKTGEYPVVQLQPFDISLRQDRVAQQSAFVSQTALEPLTQTLSPQERSLSPHNRQRMLKRVHTFWIEGVLEHSLRGAAPPIALGLQEQPDAIANPWHLVLRHPDTVPHSFPIGTHITEVYDAANGELLILGAPGSGKTTLLLELARNLLDCAEENDTYPMPVVFNLSSWSVKRQAIAEWFVEELNTKYNVPLKLGKAWVNADQVLPLLDGLDEVTPTHRAACIEAVNIYRQEHGLVPLVVCSRSAEYLAQATRMLLASAVVVQPLSNGQVEDYLVQAGASLQALRVALHQDAALRELTSTPLMLSILTLAYHDMAVEDLLRTGVAPTQQHLFEHYLQRMLLRRGEKVRYRQEQTKSWLAWLARQLVRHNQAVFYIERMQPDWLPNRLSLWLYSSIVNLTIGLLIGLTAGLVYGLTSGVAAGLFEGLAVGLIFGVYFQFVGRSSNGIMPVEVVGWSWSWRRALRNLVSVLVMGFGVIMLLSFSLVSKSGFSLINGLVLGPVSALLLILGSRLILESGLSITLLDERSIVKPNQGIWLSARNSVRFLVSGLLGFGLIGGLGSGLVGGLFLGLVGGLFLGLRYGGVAIIQHVVLRFLLWRAGSIPWNYPLFLDYAAERILLCKVGGGYMFVHRLLLDYFASLNVTPTSTEMSALQSAN